MFLWKNKESESKIPYQKEIEKIHKVHESIKDMSQDELIAYTEEVRKESNSDKQKIQAYAIAHEVIKRTLNVTPYDVQLAGGYALSEGNISQMKTGEGKTITALFPSIWGYIANLKTYVITVNEYLAERDYSQAKVVFDYLKVDIGLVDKDMETFQKKGNYEKPVVYITNSEFAFDYLRDNIVQNKETIMQGEYDFAIIDEADLVLIDEAKNPVIISSASTGNVQNMLKAKEFVLTLKEGEYEIDDEVFIPYLAEEGYDKAKEFFGYELNENNSMFHAVRQSLIAYYKFKIDVDYIVRDGEILIVDKFTGRVLSGRRFQQGLHQAIEAKEDVEIQPENVAVAMVTYQNLFRKFSILSGMTGTGIESKKEFEEIYSMDVKVIPTNKPVLRIDHNDVLFHTISDKYAHLQALVIEKHEKGQPVLIGTISVKESEQVSALLEESKIPFQLLNAKNDKQEAEIVEKAGERGAITIATNMAGRGTDIQLTEEVESIGGLFVLGVSRNESKRIDRQLQGRSGRQGQAGESQFLSSIEDEFLVMYPTSKVEKFVKKNKDYPVTKDVATKMVDDIQLIMDSQSQMVRKFQFQMDEILHYQREYVYKIRKEILLDGLSFDSAKMKVEEMSKSFISSYNVFSPNLADWDLKKVEEELDLKFGIKIPLTEVERVEMDDKTYLIRIQEEIVAFLEKIEAKIDSTEMNELLRGTAMQVIDNTWTMFLGELEEYKQGFAMTSMGEQDPIRKFSMDVDAMFKSLLREAYVEFFSLITKRGDILLTIENHSFYTVFPMKNEYHFRFKLDSEDEKQVKSVLYGERAIIDEFKLSGTSEVVIMIPYTLNPGKYVLKNFVDGKEINCIGFKVIAEGIDEITTTTPAIVFRLPVEELPLHTDENFKVRLIHVFSDSAFEFEVPSDNEWINIEKPDNQNWMLGRYVITVFGANLPLYHREYLVLPKETERKIEKDSE